MRRSFFAVLMAFTLILSAINHGRAEVRVTEESGPGGKPAYRIENPFYRLRLVPSRGGRVDEFTCLGNRGVSWIISKVTQEGLFMDHVAWGWPGELLDAAYAPKVLERTPECFRISLRYRTKTNLQLEKVMTFKGGSRAIGVDVTIGNQGDASASSLYWAQHVFVPGPRDQTTRFFRPSAHGLDIATVTASKSEPQTTGDDYVRDPLVGWTATLNTQSGNGAMFVMDYNYLSKLYNCRSFFTTEWFGDMLRLPPGQSWNTRYRMVPVTDFPAFVHGSERLLADLQVKCGEGGQLTLTHQIAAVDEGLPAMKATVKIHRVPEEQMVWEGTVSIPATGREPSRVEQQATGLPAGNVVVRVGLEGSNISEHYELLVAKTEVSIMLNPARSYCATRPAKQKVFYKPKDITLAPHPGQKVLFIKGPFFKLFRVEEAFAKRGTPQIKSSWQSTSMWSDSTLTYFPATYEEMMGYDLVVLANIDGGSLPDTDQEMLKDFVEAGGSLLVLGGWYAFGNGGYATARFSGILPVNVAESADLKPASLSGKRPEPAAITPTDDPLAQGVRWKPSPQVRWYHRIQGLKKNAAVILKANADPLVVAGRCGKGKVMVVLAAPLGRSPASSPGFWEWSDWPPMMRQWVEWLMPSPQKAGIPPEQGVPDLYGNMRRSMEK